MLKLRKIKLQYISDLHVDVNIKVPPINKRGDYLAICGDVGTPRHISFKKFFDEYSKKYDKIFFVAGNHDYDCSPLFNKNKVIENKKIINDIFSNYNNVYFLDNNIHNINDDVIIAGTTLWTHPVTNKHYPDHIERHINDVCWLNNVCQNNLNKKIIVLSHYVPTFKLIDKYYMERGIYKTSWFATNLEHMIKPPIVAWLCGHTHSVTEKNINGIYCGVNAVGHNAKFVRNKIIIIE